ncbi:MAG: aminotransferase class IV [Bacteroidota bacterium]
MNKLSTLKSANALPYVLAGLYAREKKLDDCIMLNDLGTIAESVSSNLFIVLNRVLYTPSETQGCVCGVMRDQVIDLARKNRLEVQECPLNPQHLVRADEVFLTNAVSGIRWVQAFRSKRYYNDVGRLLQEALNKRVASLAMDLQEN